MKILIILYLVDPASIICLCLRLSHACLSKVIINRNCIRLIITVIVNLKKIIRIPLRSVKIILDMIRNYMLRNCNQLVLFQLKKNNMKIERATSNKFLN